MTKLKQIKKLASKKDLLKKNEYYKRKEKCITNGECKKYFKSNQLPSFTYNQLITIISVRGDHGLGHLTRSET